MQLCCSKSFKKTILRKSLNLSNASQPFSIILNTQLLIEEFIRKSKYLNTLGKFLLNVRQKSSLGAWLNCWNAEFVR
jgi:hypothetical protein